MKLMCSINDGIEDTEHFWLLCDSFKEHRCNLLTDVNVALQNSGNSVWSNSFLQLLLYGDESLSYEVNRSILTLTITYILKTGYEGPLWKQGHIDLFNAIPAIFSLGYFLN